MKLDDLARRSAKEAHDSAQSAAPPPVPGLQRIARRRDLISRGGALVAATAVLLIAVGVAGTLGNGDAIELRISDPAVTTSTGPQQSTTVVTLTEPDGIPIFAGIDEATAQNLPALPHPGATVLTESDLTDELITQIRSAVAALDFGSAGEPHQVQVAFEKDGLVYTTVDYGTDGSALLVVEDGRVSRFRLDSGTWVDVHGIRKAVYYAYTQVSWLGLPDSAATARMSTPERSDDIEDQAVIGNAVFFEIAKPSWTQIGTLTLFDDEGETIATEEVKLHGSSCSAGGVAPVTPKPSLPEAVDAGRMELASATDQCRTGTVAGLAVGDGPYFDVPMESLAAELRDADQRTGLLRDISLALRFGQRQVEGEDGTVYVFTWPGIELGFNEDGTWVYASFVEE